MDISLLINKINETRSKFDVQTINVLHNIFIEIQRKINLYSDGIDVTDI